MPPSRERRALDTTRGRAALKAEAPALITKWPPAAATAEAPLVHRSRAAAQLAAIGVQVEEGPDFDGDYRHSTGGLALTISYRWFSPLYAGALAIVALPFVLFYLTHGPLDLDADPMGSRTLLAVFVAFSVYCAMVAHGFAGGLLNRTTLRERGGALSVRHAPVPSWGSRTVALGDVVGFTCRRRESHFGNAFCPEDWRSLYLNSGIVFDLCAELEGGALVPLLRGFDAEKPVLLLKQTLDGFLERNALSSTSPRR